MKFVNDRRGPRSNNNKSVLKIKTLMTGKHSATPTTEAGSCYFGISDNKSKRSTQVLVNEGPSLKEHSLELTTSTLDPTESPTFTSNCSSPTNSLIGAELADTGDLDDPYLTPNNNNNNTRVFRHPKAGVKADIETSVRSRDEKVPRSNDLNQALSPLSNPVITFRTLTCSSDHRQIDEASQSLSYDSLSRPEQAIPQQPKAKLSSLGAFDFPTPVSDSPSPTTCIITPKKAPSVSVSKSLGSGCFDIPAQEQEQQVAVFDDKKNEEESTPKNEGIFSSSSPLSALGKGLALAKTIGNLSLPRVLHFNLLTTTTTTANTSLQQPSHNSSTPVPVCQAGETTAVGKDLQNINTSNTTTTDPRINMMRHHMKAEQECKCWNEIVVKLIRIHGKNHVKTAEGLIQLGHAYMLASEYAQAVVTFQSACRIWKSLERPNNDDDHRLAFARVVDAIGMAWARVSHDEDRDHCHKAMTALEEAFQIRYDILGPLAIDTVETLNKIASVHLHLREYAEACDAYWQVFWTRRAIFGADHPSVAVAAHALGNVFVKLAATRDAANFFQIAVDIYDRMNLPNKHPAVSRLMRDYKRLDRINLTRRIPIQEQPRHRQQVN